MAMSPETMPRRRGAMASLRPRLQVPAGSGQLLLAAGAASVATWSLGGFYQAFGPSVAAEHLGTTNPLVAAAVFASVIEAAMKLLFLVLNRAEKEWRMPPREWAMAKAQFAVLFGERFTQAMAG